MKALVFHGPNTIAWEEVPDARLLEPTDAVVRVDTTTICGTDLHILHGDVPASPTDACSATKAWGPSSRSATA